MGNMCSFVDTQNLNYFLSSSQAVNLNDNQFKINDNFLILFLRIYISVIILIYILKVSEFLKTSFFCYMLTSDPCKRILNLF